jgi:uncharacterized protein DUF4118
VVGAVGLSAALVPFRARTSSANIVLGFVVVAVIAAWIGGRRAGIIVGILTAACFNVFFTQPYNSFRISRGEDVVADLLLLVVTVSVAVAREREHTASQEAKASRDEMADLFAMARAVGNGEEELERLAGLVGVMCEAEGVAVTSCQGSIIRSWGHVPTSVDVELLDRLSVNGWPPFGPRLLHLDEGRLPVSGALLPVVFDGEEVGFMAIFPGPEPVELRRETTRAAVVAATLAGSFLRR